MVVCYEYKHRPSAADSISAVPNPKLDVAKKLKRINGCIELLRRY